MNFFKRRKQAPSLDDLVDTWLQTNLDMQKKRTLLEQTPALLSHDALRLLDERIETMYRGGDYMWVQLVEIHRNLLLSCIEKGIPNAFAKAEMETIHNPPSPKKKPKSLQEMVDELNQPIQANKIPERIITCKTVLGQISKEKQPQLWAALHNELAACYSDNPEEDPAENLERAIHHNLKSLEIFSKQETPNEWAISMGNLGVVFETRLKGERAENIEKAIHYYQEALTVHSPQNVPERWAFAMNELGISYKNRRCGSRAENIEKAIGYYQEALKFFTRQSHPEGWAMVQSNLGIAYRHRIQGEQVENIEKTISHYTQALEIYTLNDLPKSWANVMLNMGTAYSERIRGEKSDNIETAIKLYNNALEVLTEENVPEQWAMTHQGLGDAYASRAHINLEEDFLKSLFHYEKALQVRNPQTYPLFHLQTAQSIGDLMYQTKRWQEASDAYEKVFTAHIALLQRAGKQVDKLSKVKSLEDIFPKAAFAYLQIGNPKRAIEILELGRTYLLRESLERQRLDLKKLPKLGFEDLYWDYLQAEEAYQATLLDGQDRASVSQKDLYQHEDALAAFEKIAIRIRKEAGSKHPQFQHFMEALSYSRIKNIAEKTPLVYLVAGQEEGFSITIWKENIKTILLPNLTKEALDNQLGLSGETKLSTGYLGAYVDWWNTPENNENLAAWFKAIEKVTGWLWDAGIGILVEEISQQTNDVVFIPTEHLALLPLHAAWRSDPATSTGRLYAIDKIHITYAPSAHALYGRQSPDKGFPKSVLAIGNPDGSLPFSEYETQSAMTGFKVANHLTGSKASVSVTKKKMQKAEVLHFATHATAGWDDAEDAKIDLADQPLTLPIIFSLNLSHSRLAILSACETGLPQLGIINEMIGLPAGFIQAGVPGVISSMWSVNDMSTAMLMFRFYEYWRLDRKTPQDALHKAQIWLRDTTTQEKKDFFKQLMTKDNEAAQALYDAIGWDNPDERLFAHPFYWGAFSYTGC